MPVAPEKKQKVLDFLKTREIGVISTHPAEGLSPESAVVAFCETEDLSLIFGTPASTRKSRNIARNPNVTFVIFWDNEHKVTVQFEGEARLLQGEDREAAARLHIAKNPGSAKYLSNPEEQYYRVAPRWIRYSNFMSAPQEIFEIHF